VLSIPEVPNPWDGSLAGLDHSTSGTGADMQRHNINLEDKIAPVFLRKK
jgi:hypothetical protein